MGHAHCSRVLAEVQHVMASVLTSRAAATRKAATSNAAVRLLDVGCWDGEATARYGDALGGAALHGIEVFAEPAREAERRGVEVASLDLEQDTWPYADAHFDVVVCNQVLEHLKNIWLPLDEMARTTRPGGLLLVSVPNLASVHNRILLALGRQPTSIRIIGPHVRGYALHDFLALLRTGGQWEVCETLGVGFPPLPAALAGGLARLWPGGSHTPVVVCRRTTVSPGSPRRDGDHQTYYGKSLGSAE